MELYQIRYFLAVADTMNFTRAAERCFVSQPALTKAIQRLEETIGCRLFDRTKKSVQLTEFGMTMLHQFRLVYETASEARAQARRLTRGQKGSLRVGVMCTIDFAQVLDGFAKVFEANIDIELAFNEGNLEALSDALDRGEIDLGVMCSPFNIPRRFNVIPLFKEHYVVAIGDDHRFNGRKEVEFAELHRERYCERLQCEYSTYIEQLLDARNIVVEVVQAAHREDWIQNMVRSNFGIAFMPVSIASAAGLAHVFISDCPIVREVSVLSQSERPLSAGQQRAIDSLIAHQWTVPGLERG